MDEGSVEASEENGVIPEAEMSDTAKTEVKPQVQESKAVAVDVVGPLFKKPFEKLGKVTAENSVIPHSDIVNAEGDEEKKERVERSFFLRRARAKLYNEILYGSNNHHELVRLAKRKAKNKIDIVAKRIFNTEVFPKKPGQPRTPEETQRRKNIIEEAHERDRLAKEFLNQGEAHVELPGLGEQVSRYTILNPELSEEVTEAKPTIYIVPGISNDLDSIEGHAQDVARRGRKVVALGYPEGFAGSITQEFADKVSSSDDLSTHAEYFKEVIKALSGGDSNIELWGLSAGSAIVANILTDPEFQNKVSETVLISPAGSVDQSVKAMSMINPPLDTARSFISRFSDIIPSAVYQNERRGGATPEQKSRRAQVLSALIRILATKSPDWGQMKVKDGGKINIIVAGNDNITKAYDAVDDFKKSPQVEVAVMPDEFHLTSFNSPAVLDKIEEVQNVKP